MTPIVIIGALLLGGLFIRTLQPTTVRCMEDEPVSIENIRRGVANGWYTARLCRVHGKPAILLMGKDTQGRIYQDIYPISDSDWQILKDEGYEITESPDGGTPERLRSE